MDCVLFCLQDPCVDIMNDLSNDVWYRSRVFTVRKTHTRSFSYSTSQFAFVLCIFITSLRAQLVITSRYYLGREFAIRFESQFEVFLDKLSSARSTTGIIDGTHWCLWCNARNTRKKRKRKTPVDTLMFSSPALKRSFGKSQFLLATSYRANYVVAREVWRSLQIKL